MAAENESNRPSEIESVPSQNRDPELIADALGRMLGSDSELLADLGSDRTRLTVILQQLPSGVILVNAEGFPVFVNQAAAQIVGPLVDPERRMAEQITAFQVRDAESGSPEFPGALVSVRALAGEVVRRHEVVIRPPGTLVDIWISMSGAPLYDPAGQVVGAVVVLNDVTPERTAQRDLVASERRFRALVEHAFDGILVLSKDVEISYCGPELTHLLGWEPDEFIGRPYQQFIHPDDRPEAVAGIELLRQTPRSSSSRILRIQHKNGTWRWMEGVATNLIEDPAVGGIVLNYRDVTERRETEAALGRYHDRLQSLLAEVSDVILVVDAGGTITFAGPSVERLLGYRPDDLIGQSEYAFVHPEDHLPVEASRRQTSARWGPNLPIELRIQHQNGDWRLFEGVANNQFANPSIRGVVITGRDVTERRLAEQALREAEAERARLEGVTLMARELAHRLNNDLSQVVGNVELIASALGDPLRLATLTDRALNGLDALSESIRRFQSVVRVEVKETPVGPALDLERSTESRDDSPKREAG